MSETSFAEELSTLVLADIERESLKVPDPCVMLTPVEQIDCDGEVLPTDIEWVAGTPFVVEETEDIDADLDLILNVWDVARLDGVLNPIQTMFWKVIEIAIRAIGVGAHWWRRVEGACDCISEALVVMVLYVDDCIFAFEEFRKGLE